jgi:hypothetical protein
MQQSDTMVCIVGVLSCSGVITWAQINCWWGLAAVPAPLTQFAAQGALSYYGFYAFAAFVCTVSWVAALVVLSLHSFNTLYRVCAVCPVAVTASWFE